VRRACRAWRRFQLAPRCIVLMAYRRRYLASYPFYHALVHRGWEHHVRSRLFEGGNGKAGAKLRQCSSSRYDRVQVPGPRRLHHRVEILLTREKSLAHQLHRQSAPAATTRSRIRRACSSLDPRLSRSLTHCDGSLTSLSSANPLSQPLEPTLEAGGNTPPEIRAPVAERVHARVEDRRLQDEDDDRQYEDEARGLAREYAEDIKDR
jgi:hypothetical protein